MKSTNRVWHLGPDRVQQIKFIANHYQEPIIDNDLKNPSKFIGCLLILNHLELDSRLKYGVTPLIG